MAKKDKKPDPSPDSPIPSGEKVKGRKEYPDDYVARDACGKVHPWGSTGVGNPSHRNLKKKCKAKKSNGEPCSLPPMKGQDVCGSHGGRAQQSLRKARERLDELADPAVYELGQIMQHSEDDSVRARAAVSIMDRTGMSPRHSLAIQHSLAPWQQWLNDMEESGRRRAEDPQLAAAEDRAREAYYERLQIEMGDDRY